jgi:hypothetical protein
MTRAIFSSVVTLTAAAALMCAAAPAIAGDCGAVICPHGDVTNGAVDIYGNDARVGGIAGAPAEDLPRYVWRLRTLCMLSDEATGACSSIDFRDCPQQPGRVIGFFVIQRRPIVQPDGTAEGADVPRTANPGDEVGSWTNVNGQGSCMDITALDPPPSPAEVFSYFQRLPLPQLTTQHQPPGNGLSGLPVIFYTDSPTTQTFTVDIRGFSVVITAIAKQFTWHTGDASGQVVSTDPGKPYPSQTVEHDYRSGTYTSYLTVTWGATFTVNGSAPTDVAGTTTTDGPPVSFDVLQARPVLTNPYD